MSGNHFSAGEMPHTPERRLPDGLYNEVEKNVVYGCTDVALRNAETGEIFLGERQTEPQLGPWFIGGRNVYGKGISENASLQVAHDFGLALPETRFKLVSTYSTEFPVAGPGREEHGRHTLNATMLIDLSPTEIAALEENIAAGDVSSEYSSGAWHDPRELVRASSDYPWVIKQFARHLREYDLLQNALHEEALDENKLRAQNPDAPTDTGTKLDDEIIQTNAADWVQSLTDQLGPEETRDLLDELNGNTALGDQQIKRELATRGLPLPEFRSDNGPRLRALMTAAAQAIQMSDREK